MYSPHPSVVDGGGDEPGDGGGDKVEGVLADVDGDVLRLEDALLDGVDVQVQVEQSGLAAVVGGVAVAGVARAGEVEEEARHPAHGGAGHQVGRRVVVVEAGTELPGIRQHLITVRASDCTERREEQGN